MKLHTVAEDPSNEVFDPYAIVKKYLDHCHPNATKFYAKVATKTQIASYVKEYGKDVWYCPSSPATSNYNLGPSKLRSNHKELAKLCGCKDWEQMTGHGLRALIINTLKVNKVSALEVAQSARHKSVNSQLSYNRPTDAATENNKQAALRPKAGRKRQPDEAFMSPRKAISVAKMPSSSTEKLKLEVESLRMQLQLAQTTHQQAAPPPPTHSYYPPPPPPPSMYNPYGAWGMHPPSIYGGGFSYPQGSYHHHCPVPMPFQSQQNFQMQPPVNLAHTGHHTSLLPHPGHQEQQSMVVYHPQVGASHHCQVPQPVQNSTTYQMQPPVVPAQTEHPTQPFPPAAQLQGPHNNTEHQPQQYTGYQLTYGNGNWA
jgi:hypothetical protein